MITGTMNWIHVSESLPEIGVAVLLTDNFSILVGQREHAIYRKSEEKQWVWNACGVSGYEWEWDFDSHSTFDPVTYWMPLPDMPNAERILK